MAATPPATKTKLSIFDRGLIVLGFVLTTAFTSYFTFVTQDHAAECQAIRNQRLADVDRFRTVASDFEPLVRTYMGDALHGNPTTISKKAVVLNLTQQRAKLQYIVPYLDANGRADAKKFDDAIVNFVVASDRNPTGVQTGPMYQQLEYILVGSQDLIAASNRATGMDSINVTTGRFWKRTLNCAEK
jgi:hypothetical protein